MIKCFGPTTRVWLLDMLNDCLKQQQIPNVLRKAKVVALLKPGKDPESPKSYRPIALLCSLYKLLERMILTRLQKCNDIAKENKDRFNILSTNIQSINSKFSELELFLEYLDSINFKFNVICMQETWKAEGDDFSPFMLHGYNSITQGKTSSSKGGLVIYIDDQYKADVVINLNSYEHWEGLIIKVNGGNLLKTLNIGNIYRPPKMLNEQINAFTTEFSSVVASLTNSNNELIIAGDFNINVLKINEIEVNSNFFDTLISHSLYPQITLPTRFTRMVP